MFSDVQSVRVKGHVTTRKHGQKANIHSRCDTPTSSRYRVFFLLEGFYGVLPSDRGSAVSSYEIREKATETHFITRNKRFSIVDLWSKHGSALEALVLRESVVTDRQDGIEGEQSMMRVEALDGKAVKWTLEESGERGQVINQVYEVIKFGCCDAPTPTPISRFVMGKSSKALIQS